MSSRQYGIQPGTQGFSGASTRAPVSPVEASRPSAAGWRHENSAPVSAFSSAAASISGSPTRTRIPPPTTAPIPPRHRQGPPSPTRYQRHQSSTTPDEDNYSSAAAGGGMSGLALGMANSQPRDSGVQALRDIDNLYGGGRDMMTPSPEPEYPVMSPPRRPLHQATDSQNSIAPLMANRSSPPRKPLSPTRDQPRHTPSVAAAGVSDSPMPPGYNTPDDGYGEYVNPHEIADDGDDGFEEPAPHQHGHRRLPPSLAAGAGTGAAAGGASVMMNAFGSRNPSGKYGPIPSGGGRDPEKSEWLQHQSSGNRRLKWIVGGLIAVLVIAAIVGGAVGGVLASKKSSSSSSGTSSSTSSKGLYDINSSQVKALLNNNALHKVFPGMDYTPLNTQYPACLTTPPDQNNITLDVAMLAQLTPAIRLYGTDCNQTEMVLESINLLGYNDTVKLWLGVWLGNNDTTNTRQLQQMYDILDTYPTSQFAGVIVGNEVLFREDLTETVLGQQLQDVRNNLTAKKISLPVATSDLGNDWTSGLAADTDIVMSNVHPFFAGVTPDVAPGWAWDFWQTHDVILTGADATGPGGYPKNIISEIGWPSSGGNDCGDVNCTSSTEGSVASVDNMNAFMEGWVCQSLKNATTYFWFEAFDEPWKVIYNTPTDQWESKWGLMDSNRNVKPGLNIPDCGGQTVDKPY